MCKSYLLGIKTSPSQIIPVGHHYHVFLVKRFDRERMKRRHFASAMTLVGLSDGNGAATGHGYLDIVEMMLDNCQNVEQNIEVIDVLLSTFALAIRMIISEITVFY